MEAQTETYEFKSEARQLLDLMIHSLYSQKDVFLRELISNASDALDKLRFEALTDKALVPADVVLGIKVWTDIEARTLTIEDNGIGMSREDLITDLGTIARSGTKEFMQRAADASETQLAALIGQFGVGFYSTFIVADRVVVVSRRAGSAAAARFESTGDGTYKIAGASRAGQGTTITLHLRDADPDDNLADFTDAWTLRSTIKKYSDFIQYPIELQVHHEEPPRDAQGKAIDGAEPVRTTEWQLVNSMKAIWTRPQAEVPEAEYAEFYRHIAHDWTDPLDTIKVKGEGTFEYDALLFLPARAPFDLYYRDARYGLQLHVNRVLIMEECKDLVPDYLRFVKGVVDSPDLSLNVSREILQKDRRVGSIRRHLVKKALDSLTTMQAEHADSYVKFWEAFGRVLKEGVVTDADNRDKIRDLLWFESSATLTPDELGARAEDDDGGEGSGADAARRYTSLAAYLERMPADQDAVYYITGESRDAVERSPHLEAFKQRGYEVLYLTDPYDEIMLGTLDKVGEKPLRSVGKGEVELGTEAEREQAKAKLEEQRGLHKALIDYLQKTLDEHVKDVRVTARLTNSAACLVGEEGDYSPHFSRLLRRVGHPSVPDSKRSLEINPEHPLIARLQERFAANPEDADLENHAHLLYGQALLAEGSPLPDPVEFSQRLARVMVDGL